MFTKYFQILNHTFIFEVPAGSGGDYWDLRLKDLRHGLTPGPTAPREGYPPRPVLPPTLPPLDPLDPASRYPPGLGAAMGPYAFRNYDMAQQHTAAVAKIIGEC